MDVLTSVLTQQLFDSRFHQMNVEKTQKFMEETIYKDKGGH